MLHWLWRLNESRRLVRWPIKLAMVCLTALVVCFPHPKRFIEQVNRWRNPNALIEPEAPALRPMIDELAPEVAALKNPEEVLRLIEAFVYTHVPYDWDWNTWGMADYTPTVAQVIQKGREDCDGRAVLAASLLRHFGFDAHLVSNFAHVWVSTPRGDIMGPGKRKAIVATDKGVKFNWHGLTVLPRAAGFGIAVFPFLRELLILCVVWLIAISRRVPMKRQIVLLVVMASALALLRQGGSSYRHPTLWLQLLATAAIVAAIIAPCIWSRRTTPQGLKTDAPTAAG